MKKSKKSKKVKENFTLVIFSYILFVHLYFCVNPSFCFEKEILGPRNGAREILHCRFYL